MDYDTSDKAYSHFNRIVDRIRNAGIKTEVRGNKFLPTNTLTVGLNSKRDTVIFTVPCVPRSSVAYKEFVKAFGSLKLSIPALSKQKKQFLLVVAETARTFTCKQETSYFSDPRKYKYGSHELRDFTYNFPIRFRNTDNKGNEIELDWKVENVQLVKEGRPGQAGVYSADVTVTAPEMKTCFFVGQDESHLFISCLPKTITRLGDVEDVLMPPEVKKAGEKGRTVKRQGEFYFIHVGRRKALVKALLEGKVEVDAGLLKPEGYEWNGKLFWGASDHRASVVFTDNTRARPRQFVLGNVSNRRHRALNFPDFYEVFPNMEVPSADGAVWD